MGDRAKLTGHSRGTHHGRPRAGSHAGASEHEVREFYMGQTTTEDSLGGLAYQMCFTREGGLIDPQVGCLHKATIS